MTTQVELHPTLDELWADMLWDACASDGPIRDGDVREAMKRGRPKIEAEARRATIEKVRAEIRANREVGVEWEPSISGKVERWYAEGYHRGLRDADAILDRLEKGTAE